MGPGGNVVVLNGKDGKLLVDTFTQFAWDRFKKTLDDFSNAPVKLAIDSHWHWDHTDNNVNVSGRWSNFDRSRKHAEEDEGNA